MYHPQIFTMEMQNNGSNVQQTELNQTAMLGRNVALLHRADSALVDAPL